MKKSILRLLLMTTKYTLYGLFMQALFLSVLYAHEGKAQYKSANEIYISHTKNNPTLLEVFELIETQTELEVFYVKDDLDQNAIIKLGHGKQRSVYDLLVDVSKQAKIKFRQVNNIISASPMKMSLKKTNKPVEIVLSDITVSGKVTDNNGESLPGVNVLIKGTTLGVVTNLEGKYKLDVPENATLVFSSIGYLSQEVAVSGRTVVDIALSEDARELEEVVVTAMGVARDRKSLGYAISKVEGKDLVKAGNPVNPFSILQGRASGVNVRQSVSGPTGGVEINIRGTNALEFEANTRPLFVIDGVPMYDTESTTNASGGNAERQGDYGSGINDLNALDIESIEVLKGAKASVLYGSAGGNGVVLITTKKGKKTKGFGVDINYQYSIERPRNYIDFQNEFGSGWNEYDEAYLDIDGVETRVQNTAAASFGPAFEGNENVQMLYWDGVTRPYRAYPNNYMFFYENGHTQSTNVAVSNGGEYGNTRFSYTNYDYQGIVPDFFQKKNTLSFAGKLNISPKVTLDFSSNFYSVKTQNRITEWAVGMVNGLNRDAPYEELMANGKYKVTDPNDPNFGYFYTDEYRDFFDPDYVDGILQQYYPQSPMARHLYHRENNRYVDEKSHLISSIRPTVYFTDWLYFVGQASIDQTYTDIENKERPLAVDPVILGGEYRVQKEKALNQEYRAFLNFDKAVLDDRLKVFVMGGTAYSKQYRDKLYAGISAQPGNTGFTYPDWYNLGNQVVDIDGNVWPDNGNEIGNVRGFTTDVRKSFSYIGLATLTWDNIYTLELNARNDKSSTLDPANNSYFYSGAAFTWNFTSLAKNVLPVVEFGKLRMSYADVGRDAPSTYFATQSLQAGSLVNGTDALRVSVPSSLFGGVIRPERKREFEIGTEMNFFKGNRLSLDFSYYNNHVYDQIMSVQLTQTSGATSIKLNAGDVQNWGFEVGLNGTPIQKNNLRWDLSLTMASQHNKIVELFPGLPKKVITNVGHGIQVLAKEGERSGNIYAVGPRTVESGPFAGRPIVEPGGVSYVLDDQEDVLTGNIYPNFLGGFSSNFTYKGFNLGVFLDYSYGASVYNFADYVLKGTGTSAQSLQGRNEKYGGIAYYIDDATGENIPWEHNQAAPANAVDGLVYHDGIVLSGVQEDLTDIDNPVYTENEVIVSASDYYYSNYVYWTGGQLLDGVNNRYDNDYIKLREVSLSYNFPYTTAQKLSLQNLSIALFARNLGYLYKTMPNFDAEASTGTKTFKGETVLPSTQSFGFQISLGI